VSHKKKHQKERRVLFILLKITFHLCSAEDNLPSAEADLELELKK